MQLNPGDRVTVLGIPGVHTVIEIAMALMPAHVFVQIRLAPGTEYGRFRGGDTLAVEGYRCSTAYADRT